MEQISSLDKNYSTVSPKLQIWKSKQICCVNKR